LKRGHHPPQRLALELGLRWELPIRSSLARTRALRPQRGLPRAERRKNVVGAFRPRSDRLPSRLALIDDVYTTGATASAAASALRKGGARAVHVITFARTVRAGS
jgi:predicted amidophosphoribosyltransferase